MAGRSEARRFVLQMLYLLDHQPDADRDRIAAQLSAEFKDAAVDHLWLQSAILEKVGTLNHDQISLTSLWIASNFEHGISRVERKNIWS